MTASIADRVAESSTTTGTGAFTLGGALTGYRTFATPFVNNDTPYYAIIAVDANGSPTGQWEVGQATFNGITTLTRTSVSDNSNGDTNPVNFSAGTKQVWCVASAAFLNGLGLPGGTGSQLQYRSSATAFGGIAGSSWDGTTLTLPSTIVMGSGSSFTMGPSSTFTTSSGDLFLDPAGNLDLGSGGGLVFQIDTSSRLKPITDAASDLGVSGANRMRNGFFSGTVEMGTLRIDAVPSAVTHTVAITSAADSVTNFGHVLQINMNGTVYFVPCGTVQP